MEEKILTPKKALGVCAWMADKFEIDVTLLRAVFVIAFIVGVGSPLLIYLVLAIFRPDGY